MGLALPTSKPVMVQHESKICQNFRLLTLNMWWGIGQSSSKISWRILWITFFHISIAIFIAIVRVNMPGYSPLWCCVHYGKISFCCMCLHWRALKGFDEMQYLQIIVNLHVVNSPLPSFFQAVLVGYFNIIIRRPCGIFLLWWKFPFQVRRYLYHNAALVYPTLWVWRNEKWSFRERCYKDLSAPKGDIFKLLFLVIIILVVKPVHNIWQDNCLSMHKIVIWLFFWFWIRANSCYHLERKLLNSLWNWSLLFCRKGFLM